MKAIIIGGTVSAMESAIRLRSAGYEVKIAVPSTYLGEDFTGTWRYLPLKRQAEGKERLKTLFPEEDMTKDEILLNGQLKKRFLQRMDAAGVPVCFMTRAAGVKSENGRITHVLLADKLGTYSEECDLLIDGTLYHDLSFFLTGAPVCLKAGTYARLTFEYMGMKTLPAPEEQGGWRCLRGAASEDHAYVVAEQLLEDDVSLEEARRRLIPAAIRAARYIRAGAESKDAFLINSIAPMIDAEIAPPPDKPYQNLLLPEEAAEQAPQRPTAASRGPLIHPVVCDVLVVGAGTAGVRAALAAARENASVCLAEFFTTLGGTRTIGGVQPLYDGNRNRLFLDMWQSLYSFTEQTGGLKDGRTCAASEALLYEQAMLDSSIRVVRPALPIGIVKEGRKIKSVSFVSPDGIYEIEAANIIDATGDGDLAVSAGVPTRYGDDELGATQNYSQMHIHSRTPYDTPMADQDVMNQTSRSEWTRCLRQNTERCAPFDLTEMLTVRESRRIEGRDTVTLSDIYRNRRPKDAIYDCLSDYDTHSRCFSEIGRYGVLPSHAPLKFVSVPFGALLPKEIDNLLVCAKAVSADQEAAAHMRMSPDIMCVGHIAGLIAAQSAKSGVPAPEMNIREIQDQLFELGALIRKPAGEDLYENTAQMLAARLAAGDESAFAEALLCQWEQLPDMLHTLRAAGAEHSRLLVSMTLLYYGDVSCAPDAAEALELLNREYGIQPRKDVYKTKIIMGGDVSGRDPYFRIISLVMLLAKNGCREYIPLIERVMNNTCLGEEVMIPSASRPIMRPDMHVHGTFDRMLSLACAAILMPDARFAEPLLRLYRLNSSSKHRAPVFSNDWLELKLAQAACLSGSTEAGTLLQKMCSNPYFVIRQYAERILSEQPAHSPSV